MNILVFGAGAIGSLFGGLLSKNNNVAFVGRRDHVNAINEEGLKIEGLTSINAKVSAVENIRDISFIPDIIIISVKSYDTEKAAKNIKKIVSKNTVVISLQNGLGNIEKIQRHVDKEQIVSCITTHGSIFLKPGCIKHTGIGNTIIGSVKNNNYVKIISNLLNNSGIKTKISEDIFRDIWVKAIINSSINPLTSIFTCKNGYLLENPILENLVDKICEESTNVANTYGFILSKENMIKETKNVIKNTSENHSSMLQSLKAGKKTEINEINYNIIKVAVKHNIKTPLNLILLKLVSFT